MTIWNLKYFRTISCVYYVNYSSQYQDSLCQHVCNILLPEGNVFTSICQEFCPQGGVSQHAMGRGVHPPGRLPRADTPWPDTHPGQTPPGTPPMATEVGGTHPTGKHSCFNAYCEHWSDLRSKRMIAIFVFKENNCPRVFEKTKKD